MIGWMLLSFILLPLFGMGIAYIIYCLWHKVFFR